MGACSSAHAVPAQAPPSATLPVTVPVLPTVPAGAFSGPISLSAAHVYADSPPEAKAGFGVSDAAGAQSSAATAGAGASLSTGITASSALGIAVGGPVVVGSTLSSAGSSRRRMSNGSVSASEGGDAVAGSSDASRWRPSDVASGRISRKRLARHGRNAAEPWIAVHGVVYALESSAGGVFVHPGGNVIFDEAGCDATSAFLRWHPRVQPDLWLRRVGVLADA